ncbi:MAG: hypothetical protein WD768_06195 [Phycisphaeraceae bacterium]
MRNHSFFVLAVLVAAVIGFAGGERAYGMWILPPQSPVDRLVDFSKAYIEAHPKDPRGYYMLGRIHSLAYALKSTTLTGGITDGDRGKLLPNVTVNPEIQRGDGKVKDEAVLLEHLKQSVANYRKSVELQPSAGLCQLGFATALRTGSAQAEKIGLPPGDSLEGKKPTPEQVKAWEPTVKQLLTGSDAQRQAASKKLSASIEDAILLIAPHREHENEVVRTQVKQLLYAYWYEQAIKAYLAAYEASFKDDVKKLPKLESIDDRNDLVSYEAAKQYVALVTGRGIRQAEQGKVRTCKLYVSNVEKKEVVFFITPIVFSLEEHREMADLLQPDASVPFDLNGDGVGERWPWVKPTTGFLVWDPKGTGRITSGRQMFGSVTWWLFWKDGYEAMSALDDNRDGELRGEELKGIAVWFDRNTNGISEEGEVTAIEHLDVEAILVRATATVQHNGLTSPTNPKGLRFSNGRVVPTYDWVTRSSEK